jgi:sulfur-oxidizing protein SoxX
MKAVLVVVLWSIFAIGCRYEQTSLEPALPSGDPVAGKKAFVDLGCNQCHEVYGGDVPKPNADPVVPAYLGGNAVQAPSREQLIREIIDPSHRIAPGWAEDLVRSGNRSRMPDDYSEAMTVRQLTDIVAFLESRYGEPAERNVGRQR